jgi:hypothetical protein
MAGVDRVVYPIFVGRLIGLDMAGEGGGVNITLFPAAWIDSQPPGAGHPRREQGEDEEQIGGAGDHGGHGIGSRLEQARTLSPHFSP